VKKARACRKGNTDRNEPKIELAAVVGIDWADQEHAVCWRAADEVAVPHETLKQEPGALAAWAAGLQQRFGGRPVGVCLEQSRGPLIYALSAFSWIVLYPINPKSLACYGQFHAGGGLAATFWLWFRQAA